MQRVIGYIDGFNLYYGMKARGWQQYYWIDPHQLVQELLAKGQTLVAVKYFTARVKAPTDKRNRQTAFLDAIRAHSNVEVILGRYYDQRCRCLSCGHRWTGHEEKMTDSAMAAHLVADAFRDEFDAAYLIGGDTDMIPQIKMVQRWLPEKQIIVCFPPARANQEVAKVCHNSDSITGVHLQAALMPDPIEVAPSVTVTRPPQWS